MVVGMQRDDGPKRLKVGDYVIYPDLPRTLWQIKSLSSRATVELIYCGGYKPTEQERIRFFSFGGSYINRRQFMVWLRALDRANEMMVLGLIGSKE